MTAESELYDRHYEGIDSEIDRAIRAETFGEDLGQTSWISAAECDELAGWLGGTSAPCILEIACGSGGVALRLAERLGGTVVGLDVNAHAVAAATARAKRLGMTERAEFRVADADEPLPMADAGFDVVFCNDAINHLIRRERVLAEWHRVLRPGGRCLYTDPVVVTGGVSNRELAARSAIGFFLFLPPGANERALEVAGFRVARKADLTESVARHAARWLDARAKREGVLRQQEGAEAFERTQNFLETVRTLASERRLSRFAFLGEKP